MAVPNRRWLLVACATAPIVWKLFGTLIYRRLRRQTTVLDDLDLLGSPRANGKLHGNAVIAGGSIAGLLAARVLSDHFERVTIVEPESLDTDRRTRVGQWNQIHIFLFILRRILQQLFPDFDAEAQAAGLLIKVPDYDFQLEGRKRLVDVNLVPQGLIGSRPGLELLLRKLLRKHCHNIEYIQGAVIGVVASDDKSRLVAAQIRTSGASSMEKGLAEIELPLALFMDCSGPNCGAVKWLARANPAWADIPRDSYEPKVMYATGTIPAPPSVTSTFNLARPFDSYGWIKSVNGSAKSGTESAYAVSRIEGDRMIVHANCYGSFDALPSTLSEYISFCEALDAATSEEGLSSDVHDALRKLLDFYAANDIPEPKLERYKVTSLHHVRYDKAPALPANMIASGDAFIRLNPAFGQGTSMAAVDAVCLDAILRATRVQSSEHIPAGFGQAVMRKQAACVRPVFNSNRLMDYGHPSTIPMQGETLSTGAFLRKYFLGVVRLTHKDSSAGTLFSSVVQQAEPGALLMKPTFAARVLWNTYVSR